MNTDKTLKDISRVLGKERKIALNKIQKLEKTNMFKHANLEYELKTLNTKFRLLGKKKNGLDKMILGYDKKLEVLIKKRNDRKEKVRKLKQILKQLNAYEKEIKELNTVESKFKKEKKFVAGLLSQLNNVIKLKRKKERLINGSLKKLINQEKRLRKM